MVQVLYQRLHRYSTRSTVLRVLPPSRTLLSKRTPIVAFRHAAQ
jgi:hypothetical protein